MKRFLTVYPRAENVHLAKDVGMVPFILHKYYGYDSTLATYANDSYSYLGTVVPGLKILFIKRITNNPLLDVLIFLWNNRKKFDVLQLYHLDKSSLITGLFFSFIRIGRVKIYLKLDANELVLVRKVSWLKKNLYGRIMNSFSLVSTETTRVSEFLSKAYNARIQYVPNGFYDYGNRKKISFSEKENLVITVGRIGTFVKATEVLCEAFEIFSEKNKEWKLEIIGPIEPAFKDYIENYFNRNPSMQAKVTFIGEISNRDLLEKYYQRAKVFVLPSRWESFAMVFLEAAKAGCYIISSAIAPAFDITSNAKYGSIFPIDDISKLAHCLSIIANDPKKLEDNCDKIQNHAYNKFYWVNTGKTIDSFLNKKSNLV